MSVPSSSHFVGREEELATLRACCEIAAQGAGHVVAITGEPGIGKTRLAEAFLDLARAQGAVVLRGRWYESREMPPYVGFSEALGQLTNLTELVEKLQPDPYVSEACRLVPGLSGMVASAASAAMAPGLHREYLLWEGVARVLDAATAADLLVLFLDDLHWIDKASASLVAYIGARSRRQRLLGIGAYREGDVQPGHPILEASAELIREGLLTTIALGGLSRGEVAALTAALTQADVAAEFVDALYQQTEGNPLFLQELIAHLAESGLLGSSDASAPGIRPADLVIPQGVQEVIGRRLSRLSRGCQRVLGGAAVIGRQFDLGLLEIACDVRADHLLTLIDEAVQAALLKEVEATQYAFAHPLMRGVAYRRLSLPAKRTLHLRVAQAMAQRSVPDGGAGLVRITDYRSPAGDPMDVELARHLLAAGTLADPRTTLQSCLKAARQAFASYAREEACFLLETSLRLADRCQPGGDEGAKAAILTDLATVRHRLGGTDEAISLYQQALTCWDRLGRKQEAADTRRWMATALNQSGRWQEGLQVSQRGLEDIGDLESEVYLGLSAVYAAALMLTGRLGQAGPWVSKSLDLAQDTVSRGVARHLAALWSAWDFGDPEQAPELYRAARRYFLAAGLVAEAGEVAADEAVSLYLLGRIPEALAAADEAGRLTGETKRPATMADLWAIRSLFHVHRGEWTEAQSCRRAWRSLSDTIAGTTYAQIGQRAEALEHLWHGELADAQAALDASSPLSVPLLALLHLEKGEQVPAQGILDALAGILPKEGRGLLWLTVALPVASAWCSAGRKEDAAAWYEPLLPNRTSFTDWLLTETELGRIAAANEWWLKAEEHFRRAIRFCETHSLRPFLGLARYEYALMLLHRRQPPDRRQALSLLSEAGAIFAELKMERYMEKARTAAALLGRGRRPSLAHGFGLTEREAQVVRLLAEGKSNRELAGALGVSQKTVERHLANIYVKVGVNSRAAAVAFALRHGLA
jgi:DNA-binding CsgD family transcriptional regulator